MHVVAAIAASVVALATGSAYVTSLPANAEVWVDGVYAGRAPVFVDLLVSGRHAVTVSRAGWSPKLATFSVVSGQTATVSIALDRTPGSQPGPAGSPSRDHGLLSVRGAPLGAAVLIDGVQAGTIPTIARALAPGRHIVVVRPKGAPQIVHAVTVYPNTATVAMFGNAQAAATTAVAADDVLAPLDRYVSPSDFTVAGDQIAIHHRGIEVQCAIGARAYSINGKAGVLGVPPAIVQGRIYLPLSLLERIGRAK